MPKTIIPTARDKYLLEVTAGPSYNPSTHTQVPVNSTHPTLIESDLLTAHLHIRIRDYHGLPPTSPPTCPYFHHPAHTSDRYSISYSFIPKQPIPGSQLVMGFDYGHSVKHQLPPGTKTALKIVKQLKSHITTDTTPNEKSLHEHNHEHEELNRDTSAAATTKTTAKTTLATATATAASSAASSLARSVCNVYSRLGFARAGPEKEEEIENRKESQKPQTLRVSDAQINALSTETVERYLQARGSNLE